MNTSACLLYQYDTAYHSWVTLERAYQAASIHWEVIVLPIIVLVLWTFSCFCCGLLVHMQMVKMRDRPVYDVLDKLHEMGLAEKTDLQVSLDDSDEDKDKTIELTRMD